MLLFPHRTRCKHTANTETSKILLSTFLDLPKRIPFFSLMKNKLHKDTLKDLKEPCRRNHARFLK